MIPVVPPPEQQVLLRELLAHLDLSVADIRNRAGVSRQECNALLATDPEFKSRCHRLRIKPGDPRRIEIRGPRSSRWLRRSSCSAILAPGAW
jgi:hypothetical protein